MYIRLTNVEDHITVIKQYERACEFVHKKQRVMD